MGLTISNIRFKNFRNYKEFFLEDIGPLTILVGPNAIGKTNIIEGVQLLTAITSHKNPTPSQLVLWNETYARIDASMSDGKRELGVRLIIEDGKKIYHLNGKARRTKELRGILPSIMFSPDDLSLIKGSQSIKRAAIDSLGVQLAESFHVVKRDYERILQHKNRLLKEDFSKEMMESINETLLRVGVQYYCYRNALFKRLLPFIKSHYQDIVDGREHLDIALVPSWSISDNDKYEVFDFEREEAQKAFKEAVENKAYEEKQRRRALIGPHADKIEFFINGKNAAIYGSQGQQRTLVLSYKLAEVSIVREMTGQKPILLLDDVMSELDTRRRGALMNFIKGDIQTIITTTNLEYFNNGIEKEARIVRLGDRCNHNIEKKNDGETII